MFCNEFDKNKKESNEEDLAKRRRESTEGKICYDSSAVQLLFIKMTGLKLWAKKRLKLNCLILVYD